ncbi:hypothetical protein P168DRAFT_126153 [Aspergillus campestris IBT 28561]|uniref:Uncharacterized protein n=1 Tax=Aspergillus campestris (strain IBT 28561) TaxID=1392248 RepID=A0A2I1D6M4_ASPC2|nr:uncharacterized protein P168DRAFT_126153 [Aspergillus campestris IBT 28561]PKY05532.1 hypothetical protein P168DRAFT_126153 [Aspergillus campestris IBT 28561]
MDASFFPYSGSRRPAEYVILFFFLPLFWKRAGPFFHRPDSPETVQVDSSRSGPGCLADGWVVTWRARLSRLEVCFLL